MACNTHSKGPFLKSGKCKPCQKEYNRQRYLDRKAGISRKKVVVERICEIHPTALIWKNGNCKSCYLVQWRKDNPEKCVELEAARNPEQRKAHHRASHWKRREKILPEQRERNVARKTEAIAHYSHRMMQCALCPEKRLYALGLDHINGDGAQHRKHTRGGVATYMWAKKNGWPNIFRVLCHNCNFLIELESHPPVSNCKAKRWSESLKKLVIEHYSNKTNTCAECSCSDIRVLTIDHKDGGGGKHRKALGIIGGVHFYKWLRDQKFPNAFRVLCFSCNLCSYLQNRRTKFAQGASCILFQNSA
jgi:hypothetical protein